MFSVAKSDETSGKIFRGISGGKFREFLKKFIGIFGVTHAGFS